MKIKLFDDLCLPEKKSATAAAYDVKASKQITVRSRETKIVPLGFAVELAVYQYMEIRPRSGLSASGIQVQLGTVDSDYRGEVCAIVFNATDTAFTINKHDRIAQAIIKDIAPNVRFEITDDLSETERGNKGFGSTGV